MISIVMPAYNAAKYIKRAIDSVLSQTFDAWELIIVDDGSTDETSSIISQYIELDSRIRTYRLENTGSAKIPRDCAIYHSKYNYVLFLDSDDYIEKNYLQKTWLRREETNADVVLGKMCILDSHTMTCSRVLPIDDFNIKKVYNGKSLVVSTLNAWKIGFNGALIDKKYLAKTLSYPKMSKSIWMNSDEYDTRSMLCQNPVVAFSNALYYYWGNAQSVSRKLNIKQFHYICTELELHDLICKYFGEESTELILLKKQHESIIKRSIQLLLKYGDSLKKEEKKWVVNNLKKLSYLTFGNQLFYYFQLDKQKLSYLRDRVKSKLSRLKKRFKSDDRLIEDKAFNDTRVKREKFIKLHLQPFYEKCEEDRSSNVGICSQALVINVNNGFVEGGGLADRLRGIVSTYMLSKQLKKQYKLLFTSPFDLSLFLVPNKVDWKINTDDVFFDNENSKVVVLDSVLGSKEHSRRQKEWLTKELSSEPNKQIHVYTNAFFGYYDDYSRCFNELFKPSCRLQMAIDNQLEFLGNEYVSVSLRFLNLFNDFNETHGLSSEQYTVEFKNSIREKCLMKIEELHQRHPKMKILVNSDSSSFLEYASKLEYAYVIPGAITHIDAERSGEYEAFEKTFLDFFMIANASYIYLLQTAPMHKSGYPYAASFINQRPFEIITF